jgi:hypothetical protein
VASLFAVLRLLTSGGYRSTPVNMSLQREPETHPVLRAEAPWHVKAESYNIFLRLKDLPQGAYDPLEEIGGGSEYGKFEGGLGAVVIVRYSETPVGRPTRLLPRFRPRPALFLNCFTRPF